jgi:hypothetical protein
VVCGARKLQGVISHGISVTRTFISPDVRRKQRRASGETYWANQGK